MLKVAVTGNIGAGKSEVEKYLINKGYKTLCADNISHQISQDAFVKKEIFDNFQTSDKKELADIIFSNAEKKKQLEAILHPKIIAEIETQLEKNKDKSAVFCFVPLLFESGMAHMFDKIVFIKASYENRLNRIIKRPNYTLEHAKLRMKSQTNQDVFEKKADFVIENDGTIAQLNQKVDEMLKYLQI